LEIFIRQGVAVVAGICFSIYKTNLQRIYRREELGTNNTPPVPDHSGAEEKCESLSLK